jgi:hypothetical protein
VSESWGLCQGCSTPQVRPAPSRVRLVPARDTAFMSLTLRAALADELADIIADALVAELEAQALLPIPLGERADNSDSVA